MNHDALRLVAEGVAENVLRAGLMNMTANGYSLIKTTGRDIR